MTIDAADLARHPGPLYRSVADALDAAISGGRVAAGDRLPPQRDLAFRLEVTVGTIGRAYEILTQRGLVRGEVGRGTYVTPRTRPRERLHLDDGPRPPVVDLTMNVPAPIASQALLPQLMAEAFASLEPAQLGSYPPTTGLRRHREAAARWLATLGVAASADRLVLTSGAQGGVAAVLVAAARPGDTVLVEELAYAGFISIARSLHLRLAGVALDEEGMAPAALEEAARRTGARLVIVTPNVQNPTTARMGKARREAIAAAAEAADLLVIEDDVYGPLAADRPRPIVELAPERTFYVTSLSKFLAPSLRLGIVVTPAAWLDRVAVALADLVVAPPLPPAVVMALAEERGLLARAVEEQRAEMARRHALAVQRLDGLALCHRPDALHLWLPLGSRGDPGGLALQLATEGVKITSSSRFLTGSSHGPRGLRISLGAPPDLDTLGGALDTVRRTLTGGERMSARVI